MKPTATGDRDRILDALQRRRQVWEQAAPGAAVVAELAAVCLQALEHGGQVIFFGNGGSASQADHLAAELVGRYVRDDRPALSSRALAANGALVTALGNDYGYESVFARQLEGVARAGDVVIGLSTSGRSPNIRTALATAGRLRCRTALFTGDWERDTLPGVDHLLCIPSRETPVIQELHLFFGHLLCELIEAAAATRQAP